MDLRNHPKFNTREEAKNQGYSIAALNGLGSDSGFGWCFLCHDSWMWKASHTIMYSPSSGAFPTCEDCFKMKSIEDIEKAIDYLMESWRPYTPIAELEQTRRTLKEKARAEKNVLEGK
jgi:hypothetical protein